MRSKQTRIKILAKERRRVIASLRAAQLGVLATVGPDRKPHAATVLIVIRPDLTIQFITRQGTTKYRNLLKNPEVAMSIGSEPPFVFQLAGRARQIKSPKAVAAVMEKWAQVGADLKDVWPPILRLERSAYAVFEIRPSRITALDLRRQTINSKEPPFLNVR